MELTFTHSMVILFTIALVIGISAFQSKSSASSSSYSVGGRKSGALLVAGSIAGTIVGGGATVGTAQLAYSFGLSAWWFTLGSGIAFIIMGIFYAKPMRETALETIPQYLGLHYGEKAETVSSLISSVGILLSAVASTLSGIELVAHIFNVGPILSSVILIGTVAVYTFFGGMKGAGVGGMLKMGIIACSLLIAGFGAYSVLDMKGLWISFPPSYFSLFGRGVDSALGNLFSVVVGVLCTQTYIQCVFSAKSPKVAAVGCFVAALIVIPVGLPSVAIGMYMKAFEPDAMPIMVLPLYLVHYVHPVLGGLGLGGIMLSLIGSIGGLSLGVGTMISKDIIAPFFHIKDDLKLLLVTKVSVILVMALACVISILNRGSEILVWNYLSMALRGGGILIPFSLAVFYPHHLKKNWVVTSMIASTVLSLMAPMVHIPMDPLFVGLIVSVVFVICGWSREEVR